MVGPKISSTGIISKYHGHSIESTPWRVRVFLYFPKNKISVHLKQIIGEVFSPHIPVSVFIKVGSVYGDSVGGEFVQDRESATLEYRC